MLRLSRHFPRRSLIGGNGRDRSLLNESSSWVDEEKVKELQERVQNLSN
ncbi:MAG: hypothetical protein U9O41_01500 [Candidatus Aerophobetes bacterium]|nr:hypothetical protein [Candidatus Aerophobetes bacterium]